VFTENHYNPQKVRNLAQVQLRIPDEMLATIDKWVIEGRYRSRSDAIKTMITVYLEREKTREFYKMLQERSEEAKNNPEILIPFDY
jgi:Arc/MetJ-type ribon-helix-helix transcriptional regulator